MKTWFMVGIIGAAIAGIIAAIALNASEPARSTVPDSPEPADDVSNNSSSPPPAPSSPIIGEDQPGLPSTPADNDIFNVISDPNPPQIHDQSLKVEKVVQSLSAPTSMAFVDERNLIVLQKNDGRVMLVSDGTLQDEPLATFQVESASERGLLGVAVNESDVFIYATENAGEVRHRVYRFMWQDGALLDKTMILDLPGTPGPNHDGGKIVVGPDGMLYAVIGDLNRDGVLQNYKDGPVPDDTSVILKVDRDGNPAANIFATDGNAAAYYAYGVRNSFGLAFDPVTDALWDTENGPDGYDEINLVFPGFNSGWERIMGPMSRGAATESDLVEFEGSRYADPLFSWQASVGLTDIAFSGLPGEYENNMFAGDINNGRLYYFAVDAERDGLILEGDLADLVADGGEVEAVTFGDGFGGITDIETGPDGNLFVLSYGGSVYRISPAQ